MLQTSAVRSNGILFGLAVLLGVPGIHDLIEGLALGNSAEAVYGAGRVLSAIFLVWYGLPAAASASKQARQAMSVLGYAGIIAGLVGLLMKHQFLPG